MTKFIISGGPATSIKRKETPSSVQQKGRNAMRDHGKISLLAFALLCFVAPGTAYAYIGPGVGAGAIAAVLGVIGSIFVGLFAALWYPIKRWRKKRRVSHTDDNDNN